VRGRVDAIEVEAKARTSILMWRSCRGERDGLTGGEKSCGGCERLSKHCQASLLVSRQYRGFRFLESLSLLLVRCMLFDAFKQRPRAHNYY
jgi:hypothetical protein